MVTDEMVEKAARCIDPDAFAILDGGDQWRIINSHHQREATRTKARAALEAALTAAEPVCCGKPVHEGSPEAYTLECCGKFVQPAPSVAVRALKWGKDAGKPDDLYVVAKSIVGSYRIRPIGREGFELRLLCADPFPIYGSMAKAKAAAQVDYEARIRSALSAQVQDVAEPDFLYRIEYDYRSYVEKKTMWGLYRELGVVSLEEAQEALDTALKNNPGNFRISRKPVVKWEPLPAAPAKQEGGTNE